MTDGWDEDVHRAAIMIAARHLTGWTDFEFDRDQYWNLLRRGKPVKRARFARTVLQTLLAGRVGGDEQFERFLGELRVARLVGAKQLEEIAVLVRQDDGLLAEVVALAEQYASARANKTDDPGAVPK